MTSILKHDLPIRIVKVLNILLLTVVFGFFWYTSYALELWNGPFHEKGNYVIILLFLILYQILGRTYDAFLISLSRISEMIYSQTLAAAFSDVIMYIVICLLSRRPVFVVPLILCFLVQFCIIVVWSVCAHLWYFRTFPAKQTVVIYGLREGMEDLITRYGLAKKFHVVECVRIEDLLANGMKALTPEIEAVYLCGVHSKDRNVVLKYCVEHDISAYVIPRVGDVLMNSAKQMHMFHLPILRVDRYHPTPEYCIIKRLFDIVASATAILLLSPVMILTAIAVKTDGGPILYKQTRLTQNGKEFKIRKFRSMRVDAEKDGVARLSTGEHDDRITKVGRFIRKVRLDELPQLFNIFFGDMSIVGPRPERPEIAKQYEKTMPEFRLRLQAKAGLTGYAQVYGKYNTTPYDKLQMDLLYISNPSFIEDIKICFATVKILFMPESTEGIEEGTTTAMEFSKEKSA